MRRIILSLLFLITTTIYASSFNPPSLREEIGQMLIMGFDGKYVSARSPIVKAIEKENIGGVILFDYDVRTNRFDKNIQSPAQVKQLNQDLQRYTQSANLKYKRHMLPLLITVDYEGGKVNRLSPAYGFPEILSAEAVGKSDEHIAHEVASTMASTLKKAGFNLDFAPDVDVNVNPSNPIIGMKERSFSAYPDEVSRLAKIYSKHFLTQGIQCAYKHFPGHGSSRADSHLGFVDVTDSWKNYELALYQQLLNNEQSCGMIMSGHLVNRKLDPSGLPATLSHKLLTDVLRNELHFKGVVTTDDMQMKAISDNYSLEKAVVLAINAGADMLIFGNNLPIKAPQEAKELVDLIEAKVNSGEIKKARIDQAYYRIFNLKNSIKQH